MHTRQEELFKELLSCFTQQQYVCDKNPGQVMKFEESNPESLLQPGKMFSENQVKKTLLMENPRMT